MISMQVNWQLLKKLLHLKEITRTKTVVILSFVIIPALITLIQYGTAETHCF